MIILLHVSIALVGLAYLTALLVIPARLKFSFAYISLAATIISGIVVMIAQPAAMAHVCVSGTAYTLIALAAIAGAKYRRQKLASLES